MRNQRWPRPVAIAVALVACVAGLATSGCGGTRTVVEHRTVVVREANKTIPPSSSSTPAPSTTQQEVPSLGDYSSSLYSAQVPTGWTQEADEVQKGGYVESKWRDPAHPRSVVQIDAIANDSHTPAENASQVRASTSQTPGYSEISSGSTTLGGNDAWRWAFDVSGTERVDYFRNDCGTGVAVMGVALPSDFGTLEATFRQVAESVSASCSTSTDTSTSTSSASSETSNCDPNYSGACLDPNASDYDCAGGSGDGPKYVQGPIEVVGTDHFGLDRDGDGVACG